MKRKSDIFSGESPKMKMNNRKNYLSFILYIVRKIYFKATTMRVITFETV